MADNMALVAIVVSIDTMMTVAVSCSFIHSTMDSTISPTKVLSPPFAQFPPSPPPPARSRAVLLRLPLRHAGPDDRSLDTKPLFPRELLEHYSQLARIFQRSALDIFNIGLHRVHLLCVIVVIIRRDSTFVKIFFVDKDTFLLYTLRQGGEHT